MKGRNRVPNEFFEVNLQNNDIFRTYLCNSQFHYKDLSSFNYEHRIRLNPKGEVKTMDIKNQYPVNHVRDSFRKNDYISDLKKNVKNSNAKAKMESKITSFTKAQNYQTLLKNDKHIKNMCDKKTKENRIELENKKEKLKNDLARIINDALLFSKKNNPIKAMLPENINEIVDKAKKNTQNMSFTLNISNLSKISSMRGKKEQDKNAFLSSIGVDMENLTVNHVNIDINKAWDIVTRMAKGRNVEEILRYKAVNAIMGITERKSSDKVRKIYGKLDNYKNYMEKRRLKEEKMKQKEEEERFEKLRKDNPKEYVRLKMLKSLSEPQLFNINEEPKKNTSKKKEKKNKNDKKSTSKKKMERAFSAVFPSKSKKVTRLNAYEDINSIINFIDNSKKESQSKFCRDHFINLKLAKNTDINIQTMLKKNEIVYK